MIADAEQHRDEDRRLRELTDARNELDAAAYQVEKTVNERGDSLPVHEKARAGNLVADARQALKEGAPIERIRPITAELQAIYQVLSASPTAEPPGEEALPSDDDVIDAEFTSNE